MKIVVPWMKYISLLGIKKFVIMQKQEGKNCFAANTHEQVTGCSKEPTPKIEATTIKKDQHNVNDRKERSFYILTYCFGFNIDIACGRSPKSLITASAFSDSMG